MDNFTDITRRMLEAKKAGTLNAEAAPEGAASGALTPTRSASLSERPPADHQGECQAEQPEPEARQASAAPGERERQPEPDQRAAERRQSNQQEEVQLDDRPHRVSDAPADGFGQHLSDVQPVHRLDIDRRQVSRAVASDDLPAGAPVTDQPVAIEHVEEDSEHFVHHSVVPRVVQGFRNRLAQLRRDEQDPRRDVIDIPEAAPDHKAQLKHGRVFVKQHATQLRDVADASNNSHSGAQSSNLIGPHRDNLAALSSYPYLKMRIGGMTRAQRIRLAEMIERNTGQDTSQVLHAFPDGWTIRNPNTYGDWHREGSLMGNCLSEGGDQNGFTKPEWDNFTGDYSHQVGSYDQLSLRDPDNLPHATFSNPEGTNHYYQILGQHNQPLKPLYMHKVLDYIGQNEPDGAFIEARQHTPEEIEKWKQDQEMAHAAGEKVAPMFGEAYPMQSEPAWDDDDFQIPGVMSALEEKQIDCPTCGDPLVNGDCLRCDWGKAWGDENAWSPVENPSDPTRSMHPGIQASWEDAGALWESEEMWGRVIPSPRHSWGS